MDLPPAGASHPAVRRALELARGVSPERGRLLLAEGIWAHEALLDADVATETFLCCPEAAYSERARDLADRFAGRAGEAYRISARILARLSDRDKPDGLVSVAVMPSWSPADIVVAEQALVLVADGLETPGNLGTLVRTLDACAADCLVLTDQRTRMSHPQVFRASHGTSLTVPHLVFDTTAAAAQWLLDQGFAVYLADNTAETAVGYRSVEWARRTAIVVGNERFGVSSPWRAYGFTSVAIPMLGRADSLNASIAASVLLFEARAAQRGW